jgi:hypothetical protein
MYYQNIKSGLNGYKPGRFLVKRESQKLTNAQTMRFSIPKRVNFETIDELESYIGATRNCKKP